ncbi:MAG TPA: diaminopropionate ammonia-lyase [Vicinamibacterales bacterium]|nr:diaminopropionate ammonia-lyase [Vicinamibacterales bacterium]
MTTEKRERRGLSLFTAAEYDDVQRFFESRPHLTPTPLVHLTALAKTLGLADILVKDESTRFGLNAFKIVGVAYAVDRLLTGDLLDAAAPHAAAPTDAGRHAIHTLVCASEGNHGRAVARAARERGLRAVVYLRRSAAEARVDAIRDEGAGVILVDGTYDDAVRRMAGEAERSGGTIVSDTAWPGYEAVPRAIMAGYTWIMTEAARQWTPHPPDIVVVQAGVGGLAGAVGSWLTDRMRPSPAFICAEPTGAACVRASLAAGRAAPLVPSDTIMNGLCCGEVSSVALPVLAATVDSCVLIEDRSAMTAMEQLARPLGADAPIEAGASGACGLAALCAWAAETPIAPGSRAFVINTEGTTDPARYARREM